MTRIELLTSEMHRERQLDRVLVFSSPHNIARGERIRRIYREAKLEIGLPYVMGLDLGVVPGAKQILVNPREMRPITEVFEYSPR